MCLIASITAGATGISIASGKCQINRRAKLCSISSSAVTLTLPPKVDDKIEDAISKYDCMLNVCFACAARDAQYVANLLPCYHRNSILLLAFDTQSFTCFSTKFIDRNFEDYPKCILINKSIPWTVY
jgi:hypothetical protein